MAQDDGCKRFPENSGLTHLIFSKIQVEDLKKTPQNQQKKPQTPKPEPRSVSTSGFSKLSPVSLFLLSHSKPISRLEVAKISKDF